MTKEVIIKASELHRAAGKMLKRVALEAEHLVVERDGYPVAVLLSFSEYEELMRLRALATHRNLVLALGKEAEEQDLNEKQLLDDLKKDKLSVYKETYGTTHA